jgi:dimethylamine/trimethylamine dehydrogenase
MGVTILSQHALSAILPDAASLTNKLTGALQELSCDGVILVVDRLPDDELYRALKPEVGRSTLRSLRIIGDAEAPGIIAQAIYSGHLAAREFDQSPAEGTPFLREYLPAGDP